MTAQSSKDVNNVNVFSDFFILVYFLFLFRLFNIFFNSYNFLD